MADAEEIPTEAQAPVEEATKDGEEAASEEKAAEPEEAEKEVAAKSPKKSPAKAKKEEPAAEEAAPKENKARAKKNKKEEEDADEDEEDGNVGQYWDVQQGQKRQRKSLEHFKVEVAKTKEFEVKKGSGKALKDIPAVVNFVSLHTIKKADPKDPLKDLSRLLFNKHGGNPREIKQNILEFNGFVFADEKAEENLKNRIHKRVIKELKDIMICLAIERTGTHDELADRLFKFLKKPTAGDCTARAPSGLGKKAKTSKKRTASGKKKTSAKKGAKKSKKEQEEEDDDDEEDDDEEGEEVKASPKKKAKASPKKKAAKDDDEDSDMDAPLVMKVDPYLEKLKGHVKQVISEQNMDLLTLRKVRDILKEKYEVDIEKYKANIREYVDEIVSASQ